MKNALSFSVVTVVFTLLAVAALGPVNRHRFASRLAMFGASGELPLPVTPAPVRSARFANRAQSIWLVCDARGASDPKLAPTDVPTDAQMDVMRNAMASHHHRVAHSLWHAMRRVSASTAKTIAASYGAAWKNPHKECPIPKATVDASYNPYGEDFLYMHRQMVNEVQGALIKENLPCIAPWAAIPEADDSQWPVPDEIDGGVKSVDALATLKSWEKYFQDPKWLKKHSLAQIGYYLEVTIHNNMHGRWATTNPPDGFEGGANVPIDNRFPSDWPFDAPSYDWLGDPYGSHVNKHFWKLHGLIDQVMDHWLEANGYKTASENCGTDKTCYQWKGTWVGDKSHERLEADESGRVSGKVLPRADFHQGELTEAMLRTRADNSDPEVYVRRNFCRQ